MSDRVISATETRVHFGELIRNVSDSGETIIVERSGGTRVAIVSAKLLQDLQRQSEKARPDWRRRLDEIHEQIRREGNVPLSPSPEEVIREMREERDADIPDLR